MQTGLHRSSGTRYSIYTGDGNGRDSYIIVGNGGNLKPHSFSNKAPVVGYHPPKAANNMFMGPKKEFRGTGKEATVLKYFGDGSGRDYYVTKDSGGLIPPYASNSPQAHFYGSLRNYEKSTSGGANARHNRNYTVDANGRQKRDASVPWYSDKVKQLLKDTFHKQQQECKRLSTPKNERKRYISNNSSLRKSANSALGKSESGKKGNHLQTLLE